MDADRAPVSGASDQWWIGQFGAAPSPPRDARARVNLGGHARTILRGVFLADKLENSSTEWPTHPDRCPSMGTIRRERSRRVRRRWGAILGCAEQRFNRLLRINRMLARREATMFCVTPQ